MIRALLDYEQQLLDPKAVPPRQDFINDPLQFMEDNVVVMPGVGTQNATINPLDGPGSFYPDNGFNSGYDIPANPVRVAWMPDGAGSMELVLDGSVRANQLGVPATEWFDAYFLPWQKGFIGRMQLPIGGATRYFFTAEMNGCAFMAAGQRPQPTVAHLNVAEPEVGRPEPWVEHRQRKLESMMHATLHTRSRRRARILTKWGSNLPGGGRRRAMIRDGPTYDRTDIQDAAARDSFDLALTAEDRKVKASHIDDTITDIRVSMVGLRLGAHWWRFYYQRMIFVQSGATIARLGGKWAGVKKKFSDSRTLELRQRRFVIPGDEHVLFWPT